MAKVSKQSPYYGFSGRIGDLVFKQRNGETFVSRRPGTVPRSEKSRKAKRDKVIVPSEARIESNETPIAWKIAKPRSPKS